MKLSTLSCSLALGLFSTQVATSVIPVTNPPEPSVTNFPPTATPESSVHRVASVGGNGFENLAMRSNGQILATTAFPSALLWYIDPLSIRPPVLLRNFTSSSATLGITELAPDIFYAITGAAGADVPASIYSIDVRSMLVLPDGTIFSPPEIKRIGSIPNAKALNGMTYLSQADDFVLIADTELGGVWRFNVWTGSSDLVIKDPTMLGPANKSAFAGFGINGLRTQNQTLFYTNSGAQTMYKLAVSAHKETHVTMVADNPPNIAPPRRHSRWEAGLGDLRSLLR